MDRDVEQFFSGVRSPALVSDLITMLAAGVSLKAERVPLALLPSVILLATIGYRTYEQQIVDDYERLLERFRDEWLRVPGRTHRDADHPQLYAVVRIVEGGVRAEYTLETLPEVGYCFRVYELLLGLDLDTLFPKGVVVEKA